MHPWTRHRRALSLPLSLALFASGVFSPNLALSQEIPPDEEGALARLNTSPRHGEWVDYDAGEGDMVRAWVVYPERADPAPVVVVIHEIYALSDWIRGVADQLAAEGFIAVAPDLISGKGPGGGGSESVDRDGAVALIRGLDPQEVTRRLKAAAAYATGLPAARPEVGIVGYCWGGSTTFRVATEWPELKAAVVFYGGSPATETLATVQSPVLGHYGGDDARVNATIPDAQSEMDRLGKFYEVNIYDGAGHGFLRQQAGREGANMEATRRAWPRTVDFFREYLGR